MKIACIILVLGLGLSEKSWSSPGLLFDSIPGPGDISGSSFVLEDGDRVVFLGNALMEYDLRYGYVEYILTTSWPDRNITFRNLGWSGDTVFGEARGTYTTPPDAYGHLKEQLADAEPAVVFVAYGTAESFEGEEGIPRFKEGLENLLDYIEELGAEAVLLSPVPKFPVLLSERDAESRNHMLQKYAEVIAGAAEQRELHYLDLFHPFLELDGNPNISDNGMHLNETGYYYLANLIAKELGLPSRHWTLDINAENGEVSGSKGVNVISVSGDRFGLEVRTEDHYLPLPIPDGSVGMPDHTRIVKFTGLQDGFYSFTGESEKISGSNRDWSEGIAVRRKEAYKRAGKLLELILQKNNLFFQMYRPQNRTYLIGFRSHEQGQNVVDLERMEELIGELEEDIDRLKNPAEEVYQLNVEQDQN